MKLQKNKVHKKEVKTINKKKKKYKILPVILAIMLLFSEICVPVLPVMANSYTEGSITYTYNINEGKATITGYSDTGSATSLDIPSSLGGYPVVGITYYPSPFYMELGNITSITIPDSVTSIDNLAFVYYSNLQKINVDNNNNYYASEDGVLFNKSKTILIQCPIAKINTNYIIPESVTSIGDAAFVSCRGLTSITIPESVTNIGDSVFAYCMGLTSITIPESVTSIGVSAFYGCDRLTSITIPESVTSIGHNAFYDCTGLNTLIIENSKVTIGNYAFYNCSALTDARITVYQNPNDTNTSININGYIINLNRTIADSIAPINSGNAVLEHYINAGITGVTADNFVAVNSAVAAAKTAAGAGVNLTKSQIQKAVNTLPHELTLTQNDSTLTAQLKKVGDTEFTTSSAVTYDWYRNDEAIASINSNIYNLSNADKGKSIKAKVSLYGVESNSIYIPGVPIVTTDNTVTTLSKDTVVINGSVNANGVSTTVTFEYGTTKPGDKIVVASPSPINGTGATSVSATLSSLIANTTYYFRVIATNTDGTAYGQYETFTTVPNSYTVTFKDYDGTIIGVPQTIAEGQDAAAVPVPVRVGYTFTGWDTAFTHITKNAVVTATYTQNIQNNPVTTPPAVIIEPPTNEVTPPAVIIKPPTDEVTPPAQVTIKGTERVGKTLEAMLITKSGAQFTTSAGVTYEWYRLSDKDSSSGTLIGSDKTYKLVSSDKDKYIKVVVEYDGKTFEAIAGPIKKRESSGSSNSSSGNDKPKSEPNILPAALIPDGWQKQSDGTWKYGENGQSVVGWKKINGIWYSFALNGIMETGFKQEGDKTYYLDNEGAMATGWELVNGSWYLFDNLGAMLTGWKQVDGKWYYLNPTGTMATGWINLEGKWYYLYGDGSLAVSTVINGYTVDENGVWV